MGIWEIGLIGLLTGVLGTTIGGLSVLLWGKPKDKTLSAMLGFAGGIMMAIIFIELLPEAFEIGSFIPGFIGMLLGILLILSLDVILPHTHFFDSSDVNSRFIKTGAVLTLGVALHNLPEGLAIGTGYIAGTELGLTLAFIMFIQNIPEGMALAAPLFAGGVSRKKIATITALAGLPMGIGAFIGAFIGNVSDVVLSMGLGFAAGAMLFIVFDEIIPSAHRLGKGHEPALGALFGVLVGIVIASLH